MTERLWTGSMMARRTVVVATANKNKVRELKALFEDLPLELVSVASLTNRRIEVVEDGDTFEENARKKARGYAAALAMPALADDSGLEVDALNGDPGVRSARYAGEDVTDADNTKKLLHNLAALGDSVGPRTARFRCVLTLFDPTQPDRLVEGTGVCEGFIAPAPRGQGGFGYDPVFLVRDVPGDRTMAELSEEEKNVVSHRARAALDLRQRLREWLGMSKPRG